MPETSQYIPAGRTSNVKRGNTLLQVQTEYAQRPSPRITTTIMDNGRLLHKIERALDESVATVEDQRKAEVTLLKQHTEVIAIIQGTQPPQALSAVTKRAETEDSVPGRLRAIPGMQHVLQVENDGTVTGPDKFETVERFHGPLLRNLHELLKVFDRVPGVGIQRQTGVYEIERDRLYLVSAGTVCYFCVVRRVNVTTQYEQELKAVLERE